MFDNYPGSKGAEGVWQRIISEMPPHVVYIEAFLGSGVVLRRKRSAAISIGVDADPEVIALHKTSPPAKSDGAVLPAKNGDGRGGPGPHFICDDAISFLSDYHWSGRELVYCDPPYLMETRSCARRYYRRELSPHLRYPKIDEAFHSSLLAVLEGIPAFVMISGYESRLYSERLARWRRVTIPTITRGGPATEILWCNFPAPTVLHDYRWLGANYRERERIKKKTRRLVTKLGALPPLERSALLSAVAQLAPPMTLPLPPAGSPILPVGSGLVKNGVGGRRK